MRIFKLIKFQSSSENHGYFVKTEQHNRYVDIPDKASSPPE